MTWMFIRKAITGYQFQPMKPLSILRAVHSGAQAAQDSLLGSSNEATSSRNLRPPSPLVDYKIDIVDDETWGVLAGVQKDPNQLDQVVNHNPRNPDVVEIDDLRICGKLFYKLDRGSKEYEEYNLDFHRKKSKTTQNENVSKREDDKVRGNPRNDEQKKKKFDETNNKSLVEKKQQRVPTFNQLTGPYHEPFCLDVYISKASVRACIVHRSTSKVVAVAHSISKDMKFELGSTRNAAACAAVGKVLAQRALADDIHNIVYTPRKGEKLEGKLQSVVQSMLDNGVLVKIKLKKKKGYQKEKHKPAQLMS